MSDLFGVSVTTTEPRIEPRRSPEKSFRGSQSPKVEPRNPGGRGFRVRTPKIPGSPPVGSGSTSGFRTAPKIPGLREERIRLEKEIEEAEAELASANSVQQPYQEAFWSAHNELVRLHLERSGGSPVSKLEMLAAYDARVVTGHEWHPFKKQAEEIQRWLKRLREALLAVNKEIGT